ncbi:MAG: MgtC/SapB family protein [Pseudohongiellaceae bacterium]
MNFGTQPFYFVITALAIGLLIGIERGWERREAGEGQRVAGLRTFGLVGLLGGFAGILGDLHGSVLIGLIFIGLGILMGAAYITGSRASQDMGVTTEITVLVTFVLGVLCGSGQLVLASSSAVIIVLLLTYKSLLHGWLKALQRPELTAGLKLLLISVVLLPLLPDQGYGPGQTLNPFEIWWMVVLIAGISFIGYFAIRIAGARSGTIFTALFGGLASSTSTTLHFSRLARRSQVSTSLLASGILLSCGTMFPRVVLLGTLIHAPLFSHIWLPALVMCLLTYAPAAWLLRTHRDAPDVQDILPRNPLELSAALYFGALLAAIMLLGYLLTEWFGEKGVLILAAVSGLADVDPITLSLARMSTQNLAMEVAVFGMIIAAAVNSALKAGMALVVGGKSLGLKVLMGLGPAITAGLIMAGLQW